MESSFKKVALGVQPSVLPKMKTEYSRRTTLMRSLENLIISTIHSVVIHRIAKVEYPNRHSWDHIDYDSNTGLNKLSRIEKVSLLFSRYPRQFAIFFKVASIVYNLLREDIHVSKRDIYYTDVNLFQSQAQVDQALNNLACLLETSRIEFHVVASAKGLVIGELQFKERGYFVDCYKVGREAKVITSMLETISDIRSIARFVLVVEKESAFMRLVDDRFHINHGPCIIITGKGYPDIATRRFVKKVADEVINDNVPLLGLFDFDPFGIDILSVYTSGSLAQAYDSENLATPQMKSIGVHASDITTFAIPEYCQLSMNGGLHRKITSMLNRECIKARPKWRHELELMLERKTRLEIESLACISLSFLSEIYLPTKIERKEYF